MVEMIKSISALWSDKEPGNLTHYAKRICEFMGLLKEKNPFFFQTWYEKGFTKSVATTDKMEFNEEYLLSKLKKNANKRYADLGSSLALWTGNERDDFASAISFTVGGFGTKQFNANNCIIDLPESADVIPSESRNEILKLLTEFWKPNILLVNGKNVAVK